MAITQEKISTLDEFWPLARLVLRGPVDDPAAREKFLGAGVGRARRSRGARERSPSCPAPWTPEAVEAALRGAVEARG